MSKKARTTLLQGLVRMALGDSGGMEDIADGADALGITSIIDRVQGGSGCNHENSREVISECGFHTNICDGCGETNVVSVCDRCKTSGKDRCPFA